MVFGRRAKRERLEKELTDIVTNHPEEIMDSRRHRFGETYVKIGNKRVYFTRHPRPQITGVYKASHLYGGYRKTRRRINEFFRYKYWLHLLRPKIFAAILLGVVLVYFGLFEQEETKIHRLEKVCSSLTGFKAEYVGDGWVKLDGSKREVIDGTKESVDVRVNLVSWLLGGSSEVTRRVLKDRVILREPFDYDAGDIVYKRWHGGEIHGKMGRGQTGTWWWNLKTHAIKWDDPQATGERRGRFTRQAVEGDKNVSDTLSDFYVEEKGD